MACRPAHRPHRREQLRRLGLGELTSLCRPYIVHRVNYMGGAMVRQGAWCGGGRQVPGGCGKATSQPRRFSWRKRYLLTMPPRPAPRDLRASDADRERVVALLGEALADGRISH